MPETVDHLAAVIEARRDPADHHGPLVRRHPDPAAARPRPRLRPASSIDSAPTEGVRVNPLSQAKSLFPALKNPANRHKAVGFTPEEFHYAFTNTLTEEDSDEVWDRYAIAAPGNWVWAYGLIANFKPGHQETWVDYDADRAPLLFIGGEKDHIMPPSVNKSNAKHYKKSPGAHRVLRVRGPRPLDLRRARLGGRRRLRARVGARARLDPAPARRPRTRLSTRCRTVGRHDAPHARRRAHRPGRARRLADPHRPDLRPTRAPLPLRLGNLLHQDRRARRCAADDSAPVDAVLLSHDHHADNLDDAGRALLAAAGTVRHHAGRQPDGSRRRQRPRPRGRRHAPADGARQADPDRHRHAVPARTAAEPTHRRRGHRVRAVAGEPRRRPGRG